MHLLKFLICCIPNRAYNYIILSLADADYITLVEDLVFNIGEDLQVFSVDIINDTIVEDPEVFEVFLKVTDDDPNVRISGPNPVVVTIIDDDA